MTEEMSENKDIDYRIIARVLNKIANSEEQAEFNDWISIKTSHQEYFERLKSSYGHLPSISEKQVSNSWRHTKTQIRKKIIVNFSRQAAAVLLPLIVLSGVMFYGYDLIFTPQVSQQIQPGSSKAILKQESGKLIALDSNTHQEIVDNNGKLIGVDSLNILSHKDFKVQKAEINTLSVPKGGEYTLVLSDGTKIYLNSETEITYPTIFTEGKREVSIKGEAYFEVAHNPEKPFIIDAGESKIRVYGTSFNISNYEDDAVTHTTLTDGSISVTVNNKEYFIEPGQQFEMNRTSKKMRIHEVDTYLYTAWKDGTFRFENMRLEDLAIRLNRWYKVDFVFENNNSKNKRFTGSVSRKTEFEYFMNLIEKSTDVKIEINEETVLVK